MDWARRGPDRFADVQATVRTFDAVTRSGTVLLDDGTELPYDADAFDAGHIRLLRVGQRVRIEIDGSDAPGDRPPSADTQVTYLTILTLPDRR